MTSLRASVRDPGTGASVAGPARVAAAGPAASPISGPRQGRRRAVLDRWLAWEPVIRRIVLCALLYSVPQITLRLPVLDPDIWWHLRTGRWIVEHGRVPATDPFSVFGQGHAWVAYSWLFEALVYGIERWAGLVGLWIFRAAMTYAVAIALHRLVAGREPRFVRTIGLLAVSFVTLLGIDTERPWHFTILFSILTIAAIEAVRSGRRPRYLWTLPPAFALWANLHIQFVIGLGFLALAALCEFVPGRGPAEAAGRRGGGPILLALLAACVLATAINPYGFGIYGPVFQYAGHSFAFDYIQELRGPEFRSLSEWCLVGLAGAAAFAAGRRPGREPYPIALLAVAAFFAFHSRRDGWMLVIVALITLTSGPVASCPASERFARTWARLAVVGCLVVAQIGLVAWLNDIRPRSLRQAVERAYPEEAAAYVQRSMPRGPIYNHLDWGGYLIWRLPGYPVTIDGRTNLHGDERIACADRTWTGRGDRWSDPDFRSARVVIAAPATALAAILRLDPRFERVHEDPVAVVFRARDDRGCPGPGSAAVGALAAREDR